LEKTAKKQNGLTPVIPAKAGIQGRQVHAMDWTPVFTGVTAFGKCVNFSPPLQTDLLLAD